MGLLSRRRCIKSVTPPVNLPFKLLQPKAIIVDMRSPSLDSYEFLNAMRRSEKTRNIKSLVLMAIEISKNIQRSIIAISDDYLIEIQPDPLLYKIANLVSN